MVLSAISKKGLARPRQHRDPLHAMQFRPSPPPQVREPEPGATVVSSDPWLTATYRW
jgi:hypothetical protein